MSSLIIIKRCKTEKLYLIIMMVIFLIAFPITTYADMGPKPQITIHVINPPDKEYYLDLLVKDESNYDNIKWDRASYDQMKLALLESVNIDGWHPGLTKGTRVPMNGKLTGVKEADQMVHNFSYLGVPDDFKIILVSPDNQLIVSKEIHKDAFAFTLNYDYKTGEITIQEATISYFRQFLMTCIPTLFIEGIVLLLFGFSLRRNWKPFFGINISTQIFLTAAAGKVMEKDGQITAYFALVPIEILIFLFEMLAFSFLLRQHSRSRRVWFAFFANLFSLIAGIFIIALNK